MRTLTVRRKRCFLDSNVWPPPTILHLAQGFGEDVIIVVVVFICSHPWHPPALVLTTLWHGLDMNGNLPFEKWRKILFIIVIVVVFAFFGAFWIWFVKAFLFFFFLWNWNLVIMSVFKCFCRGEWFMVDRKLLPSSSSSPLSYPPLSSSFFS